MDTDKSTDGVLVDADTCAAAQGLTKATFYRMVKAGLIPAYRIGVKQRGLRFSIPEVRAALRMEKQ
jgi:excisionase family DNA binding protein